MIKNNKEKSRMSISRNFSIWWIKIKHRNLCVLI